MKNKVLKCRCASVQGKLGEIEYNARQIISTIKEAAQNEVDILSFPEMSLSGYSCGDVLFNQYFYDDINKAICEISSSTSGFNTFVVIGTPIKIRKNDDINLTIMF